MIVEAPGYHERLPFRIRVSPIAMGRPRLSLGMWDYTDGPGAYGITEKNMQAAIALEQSHGVDSPWAKAGVLPWPAATDFDAEGNLRDDVVISAFDEWVQRWPDARNYLVFAAVGRSFAGAGIDHRSSRRAWPVGPGHLLSTCGIWNSTQVNWGCCWWMNRARTNRMRRSSRGPRPLRRGAPELTIFQDPCWVHPEQAKLQEAITLADIVCPQLAIFHRGGPSAIQYYEQRRDAGQRLWFYQCSGPARMFDPSRYHRLTAWHAFRYGASGMGFWAFGDTGGGASSWNEYAGTRTAFTPAFIGVDQVTDGIHWQAVREGIEDYEYLSMLRDAASQRRRTAVCEPKRNACFRRHRRL